MPQIWMTTFHSECCRPALRARTGCVTRWRNGEMVMRWAATAFLHAEKSFRRIMGYDDLWMLRAALGDKAVDNRKEAA